MFAETVEIAGVIARWRRAGEDELEVVLAELAERVEGVDQTMLGLVRAEATDMEQRVGMDGEVMVVGMRWQCRRLGVGETQAG